MKVAIFAYSWSKTGTVDSYINGFVDCLKNFGFNVDVYIANEYTDCNGLHGFSTEIDMLAVFDHVRSEKYEFAISFNGSFVCAEIIDALSGKIVNVIVDDIPHLFFHTETNQIDIFRYGLNIFLMSSKIERLIVEKFPSLTGRVHFRPPASVIKSNKYLTKFIGEDKRYNISWVASYLSTDAATLLFERILSNPIFTDVFRKSLESINNSGIILLSDKDTYDLERMLSLHKWSRDFYIMSLQNILSSQDRTGVCIRLEKHGLKIFGNSAWLRSAMHTELYSALVGIDCINTSLKLETVYNSSKISINLPQRQAFGALQYRIIDIMRSDSLLLTEGDGSSDIQRAFGGKFPVPMYDTVDQLESLCDYYLSHDKERLELIAECNELTADIFSYEAYCMHIANTLNLSIDASLKGPVGTVTYKGLTLFIIRLT